METFPTVAENVRKGAERTARKVGVTVNAVLWSWWQSGSISAAEFVSADR